MPAVKSEDSTVQPVQAGPIQQAVDYGRQTILFTLQFATRKTIGISVHPDGAVHVSASCQTSLDRIKAVVRKRGGWIMKQKRHLASLPPALPPHQYRSGESFRYLGRQYRLKIELADKAEVKLLRGRLWVFTPAPEDDRKTQDLLQNWYRARAQLVFAERLAQCSAQVARYGIPAPQSWRLRRMAKRWGSCTRDGRILLNPDLVAASKNSIDYVITHELCHLVIHNHSKAYFELLARVMPDWQARKRQLDSSIESRPGAV
ncbi:MAG: SprT family zinc-dependent metalloprotease [Gammaproteobacteria bacterium]